MAASSLTQSGTSSVRRVSPQSARGTRARSPATATGPRSRGHRAVRARPSTASGRPGDRCRCPRGLIRNRRRMPVATRNVDLASR
ncbi:hypothetical protein ACWD0J_39040, partial [Streptomyces sp. NPDC003011]